MVHTPRLRSLVQKIQDRLLEDQLMSWSLCLDVQLSQRLQRGMKLLKPIVDSRGEEQEKFRNGYKKPVGFLMSLTTIPLLKVGRLLSA